MRRVAALLALTVGASLLDGCVYNPYTGTWQPCCSYYGYPYYRYPPPFIPMAIRPALMRGHLKVSQAHIRTSQRSRHPGLMRLPLKASQVHIRTSQRSRHPGQVPRIIRSGAGRWRSVSPRPMRRMTGG
jgi:hypothetical protein